MSTNIGIFLSDIHLPDEINLAPIFAYLDDLRVQARVQRSKFTVILGGDIVDAKGMHGVDSVAPSESSAKFWNACYERDKALLHEFLEKIQLHTGKDIDLVYLEGNHEERYQRILRRYPELFTSKYDFHRDVVKNVFPRAKWIPYGTYNSQYKLGDCIFTHGTIYPENHAKKYATIYAPFKVVYGHLHHFQAFTIHNAMPHMPAHYALTAGCLTHLAPEWKKGHPNMWQNGFTDFVVIDGVTTATAHILDHKGRFQVGGKVYEA